VMRCPECGRRLVDAKVMGEDSSRLACPERLCPSHHAEVKCPECGAKPAKVEPAGLGCFGYVCANGHEWDDYG
jgi:hypothetical protein